MQRGMTLNGKHSFVDFGLRWLEPVEISEPVPKTKKVDIPGRKTPLDATESLYGSVTYENRTIKLHFYKPLDYATWLVLRSKLDNLYSGQMAKLYLDIDPEFYWLGRCVAVRSTKENPVLADFEFEFDVEPFKYFENTPSEDWLWDPFNFETGIIQNLRNIPVNGSRTVSVTGNDIPVNPTITATADMTVAIDGNIYNLEANVPRKFIDIVIYKNTKNFAFTGTGKVTISFRGESL